MSQKFPSYFTDQLVKESKLVNYAKGENIFHLGETVNGLFYVIEGEAKAIRHLITGAEAVMVRSCSGSYFGESALVVDTYVCDATAAKKTKMLFIPKEAFSKAMMDYDFSIQYSMDMAKSVRRQCSRYERLRLHKAKDRLMHYLSCESDRNGQLVWQSTLVEFAFELALEPETLYRITNELERDGLIKRDNKKFQLINI